MTDAELRGEVLQKFYDERHLKGVVRVPFDEGQEDLNRLSNICDQLGQHGLITWQSFINGGGYGKITANGVDVIEGTAHSPITVTMHAHDHSISVNGSNNQVGSHNAQSANINVGKITAAIDHSSASDVEKGEAKSLLEKITSNPLLVATLGSFMGGPGQ
jgi:hypothetical protein